MESGKKEALGVGGEFELTWRGKLASCGSLLSVLRWGRVRTIRAKFDSASSESTGGRLQSSIGLLYT